MDRVVSRANFFTGVVFECDIARYWPMAVLCMLYKISCNPMHTLYKDYGALSGGFIAYVPVQVTCSSLVAQQ